MQIFGIFLALEFLGGKRGTLCVLLYILLGLSGLPVFASFGAGAGVLLGATGGYIIGFLPMALAYAYLKAGLKPKSTFANMLICEAALLICYAFGTFWFMTIYSANVKPASFASVLLACVVPYVLPDTLKIYLACKTAKLLKKITL